MTNYNLYIDDVRKPYESYPNTNNKIYISNDWDIVRSYDKFVEHIKEHGIPEVLSLDHDIADEHYGYWNVIPYDKFKEKTGYHCALWLINYCAENSLALPEFIYVHSLNEQGKINIKSLFNLHNKNISV